MTGGITEEYVLLVIPVTGYGIHAEALPVFGKDIILPGQELLVIHQDGYRASGNVPSSYPDPQSFRCSLDLPETVQMVVLDEIRIALRVHPDIRSYQDVMLMKLLL